MFSSSSKFSQPKQSRPCSWKTKSRDSPHALSPSFEQPSPAPTHPTVWIRQLYSSRSFSSCDVTTNQKRRSHLPSTSTDTKSQNHGRRCMRQDCLRLTSAFMCVKSNITEVIKIKTNFSLFNKLVDVNLCKYTKCNKAQQQSTTAIQHRSTAAYSGSVSCSNSHSISLLKGT